VTVKIATILPFRYLHLEAGSDMHMFLAHLMGNPEYRAFAKWQSARGAFTLLDNGVVETGKPLSAHTLFKIAAESGITEMTLPDKINDRAETLRLHTWALELQDRYYHRFDVENVPESVQKVMLIPQGDTQEEWMLSVMDMLTLAEKYSRTVSAIGISKFCVGPELFESRLDALRSVTKLLESDLAIHLLGCPNGPSEIQKIDVELNGRVRGVDSGLPVFYTQARKVLTNTSERPPNEELDFNVKFDPNRTKALRRNIWAWKHLILYRGMKR